MTEQTVTKTEDLNRKEIFDTLAAWAGADRQAAKKTASGNPLPHISDEEREAMAQEGIFPLDADDARLDLARRYRDLLAQQNAIKAEMEDIKLLLKEDAAQNGVREFHYNGHKIVSINQKHSRNTDLNKLFKEFPNAYKATVKESVSTSINFSDIKE